MNRNYFLLTILMLVLAFGTLFLTKEKELTQIEPDELMREIIQPTRYVSSDQIARMIIKKDPSLMLVDVRSEDEFSEFSLPGAINIPIDSLINPENLSYFGIAGTKVVFVSNDDIKADQTWMLTKRLGYNSTYVLKGGLNGWMETIIDPQMPDENESKAAFETYSFRKGAQMYFTGAGADNSESSKVDVQVQRKQKTTVAAGGC